MGYPMHLIIHGGPPKTGSTSIQRALWRSGDALGGQDCLFYKGRKPGEWALHYLFCDPDAPLPAVLRRHFADVAEARAWSAACWDEFEAAVEAAQQRVVLISSEHFANSAQPEAMLDRLRQRFARITYVAYARDPVSSYVSELDELIRGGRRFRHLPQVDGYTAAALGNLMRFEAVLDPGDLVIRSFARTDLVDGDIVADFFHVLREQAGVDLPLPQIEARINDSLCGAATAWLATLNEELGIQAAGTEEYRALIAARLRLVERLRRSRDLAALPRLEMSDPVLEAAIRSNAGDVIEWVNERYLCDQTPMTVADPTVARPKPQVLQTRMRDWMMSYVTPRAMRAIARAGIVMRNDAP